MKNFLRFSFLALLMTVFNGAWAAEKTFTFAYGSIPPEGGNFTLNGVTWNASISWKGESGIYMGFHNTYGLQIGNDWYPATTVVLKTSGISGNITAVKVNASVASPGSTTLNVSVGGTAFGRSVTLATSPTEYTFTGTAAEEGEIVISFAQPSTSRAIYIKSITVVTEDENTIDFESDLSVYSDWIFSNIERGTSDVTAHGGSYYGITTEDEPTASITTKEMIARPKSLTCYVSKTTENTTQSSWVIRVSSDGSEWTDVERISAKDMSMGEWIKFSANLSGYRDVYVRVYYSGSTAVRAIDDLTLNSSAPAVAKPTFSPAGGEYSEAQSVTISCETEDATIYYTTDGSTPTVESTKYTEPINVSVTTTIKAIAYVESDVSSVAMATYTIVDPNGPGTSADNPYTVEQARTVVDAGTGTGVTGVYAKGIVSEIVTAFNSQNGNITYNISADGTTEAVQLQAYQGKSYNGDNFTSEDDIQVGDEVVIYGNLIKYNQTYEFAQDNQLVSLKRPETPVERTYREVRDTEELTSGKYLIVFTNSSSAVAFDGSLETLDAVNNIQEVEISGDNNDEITTDQPIYFTLDVEAGTVQSASGWYIGVTSNDMGLKQSKSADSFANKIFVNSYDGFGQIDADFDGSVMSLRYNGSQNERRFRYYDKTNGILHTAVIQLFKEVLPETVDVTISESTYATFYYESKAFVIPEGVTASAVVREGSSLSEIPVENVIPASCPVLLHGAAGEYEFVETTEEGVMPTANSLIGSEEGGTYNEAGYKYYVLSWRDKNKNPEEVGFYFLSGSKGAYAKVKAHQAYMRVVSTQANEAGYVIGETTGITSIAADGNDSTAPMYNLAGQRVNDSFRGVVIQNGKKTIKE